MITPPAIGSDRLEPLVARVEAWVASGQRWFALDGLGACGKSTLARALAERVGMDVIALDDFTRPGAVGWERDRFREQVWEPAQAGRVVRYQRHHWTSPTPTDWVELPAAGAVLVEGIGASEPPEGVHWDKLIWVSAAEAVRGARADERDPGRFGCWSQTWRPIEQEWFERAEPWRRADLVWVNA